jgi:hypothetical protein
MWIICAKHLIGLCEQEANIHYFASNKERSDMKNEKDRGG